MRASNENKVQNFLKSSDPRFTAACAKVPPPWGKPAGVHNTEQGIPASRRQASKWLMKKGIAYKFA